MGQNAVSLRVQGLKGTVTPKCNWTSGALMVADLGKTQIYK